MAILAHGAAGVHVLVVLLVLAVDLVLDLVLDLDCSVPGPGSQRQSEDEIEIEHEHGHSILAFRPVLTDQRAIRIRSMVTYVRTVDLWTDAQADLARAADGRRAGALARGREKR